MGWKIVEIETADRLRLFLDNLVIYKDNDKIIIPINDIDTLIIDNIQINLSIQLINKLADSNVNVVICDKYHLPNTQLLPFIGNYNSLKILNRQLNWNHQYKSNLWKNIVKQKITNQIELLSHFGYYGEKTKEIELLLHDIKDYDISNREGHAAKIYWHTLFGIDFNRRDEENPINKYLNYGYAILRSYFSKSIVKKGLDPRISIFHKSFHNHFALSSDLMEVFRTIIDFEVIKIVEIEKMKKPWFESKQKLIECFNKKIIVDDKEQFINNAIDKFIDAIVNEKKLPKLIFPFYEWN
ncbi:MAG: type II CRISPR-associated endonuclease Cas1 [Mycoplasmataceae bacterium]|nr:type II CRISPR-associated endonuclease Cas1 [Mycoplasmataceae bacterium]